MDNGKEAQINAFLDVPGPHLVIHIADEISHDRQRSPLVASGIHEALHRLFPNEKTKVVNLMPLTKPRRHEDPPFAFFAYNMQPSTYEALVNQYVWRTDFIWLWAYPIEPITPSYLGYIIDLSSIEDEDNITSVRKEIIDLWLNSPEVGSAIRTILARGRTIDSAGDEIILDNYEVEDVINRLRIYRLATSGKGRVPRPSINMYITGLNCSDAHFKRLKNAIGNIIYDLNLHRSGEYGPGWLCGSCHSLDHPTGLCHYLSIEHDIPLSNPIIPALPKAQQPPRTKSGPSAHGGTPRGRGGKNGGNVGGR
jgi:hypothetical protein